MEMRRMRVLAAGLLGVLAIVLSGDSRFKSGAARGQETPATETPATETPANGGAVGENSAEAPKARLSPLGVRQQRVERMMEDLDRKFKSLVQTLEKSEPERAKRLVETLQQSKQMLIQQRMAQVVMMLNEARLDTATGEQKQILADLRKLIQMLLDETDDKEKLREELERLERWKEEINKLLKEEYPQRRESDKIANKDKSMNDIDGQIKAVEELIKKQQGVITKTEAARGEGVQKLTKVGEEQRVVREETSALAESIAKNSKPVPTTSEAEEKPAEGENGESKEGEPKEGDAEPKAPGEGEAGKEGEGNPKEGDAGKEGEGQEGAAKEGEGAAGKEGAGKEGAGKEGAGKGGAGKEGAGKEGSGKEGAGKEGSEGQPSQEQPSGSESSQESNASPEPGQRPLERAAENQREAEKELGDGKGKAAETEEQEALAELNKALEELKRERRRIESLPPEAFDELAKRQEQTSDRAAKLAEEMKKAAEKAQAEGGKGGEGQGGEGQGGKGGQKAPGKDRVAQAQKAMQKASSDLRQQAPADATRQQDEAIKQLEKALQEIEERLKQLREETQEERLARLEARFREMLARQQEASKATVDLEKKRLEKTFRRTDRVTLAKQAKEERALAEMAGQALDILIEDGGSIVFPHVVTQLQEDLNRAGEMLDAQKTDGYTQLVQQEIESTLEELIEALQKLQKDRKGGGGGGGGGGNEPLLPNSAELKLLKAAQLRVNRRTAGFDRLRPDGPLDEVLTKEVVNISERQAEVAALTQQVLERVAWPPQ